MSKIPTTHFHVEGLRCVFCNSSFQSEALFVEIKCTNWASDTRFGNIARHGEKGGTDKLYQCQIFGQNGASPANSCQVNKNVLGTRRGKSLSC